MTRFPYSGVTGFNRARTFGEQSFHGCSGCLIPCNKLSHTANRSKWIFTIEMRCIDIESMNVPWHTEFNNTPVVIWIVSSRLPSAVESTFRAELAFQVVCGLGFQLASNEDMFNKARPPGPSRVGTPRRRIHRKRRGHILQRIHLITLDQKYEQR
jgi:hypothetical protein